MVNISAAYNPDSEWDSSNEAPGNYIEERLPQTDINPKLKIYTVM